MNKLFRLPFLLSAASIITTASFAHQHRQRPPPLYLIPFTQISKSVGFKAIVVSPAEFNLMGAFRGQLTPSISPKIKSQQPVLQLEYGAKSGGIITIYEAKKIAGITGVELATDVLKARIFGDRNRAPGFTMIEVKDSSLVVAVAGSDPEIMKLAISTLKKEK